MLEVDGLKISISRGDTGSVTVTFTGEDTPADGTVAQIELMRTMDSPDPLWVKQLTVSSGRVTIPFFAEDSDYPRGMYCWILRLLYENGDRWTPMDKPKEFRILPAGTGTGGDGGGG